MSRREKNKARTRVALAEAAFALFSEYGFEATTVDEIADAAGVSRRTFFRYFPTKEAVVFPFYEERLTAFRAFLDQGSGPAADRVIEACLKSAAMLMEHRDEQLLQHRLIQGSPSLVALEHEVDGRWEAAIAEVLAEDARTAAERRRAEVWAAAIMGAVRATLRTWFAGGARADLVKLGQEALTAIEQGMGTAESRRRAPEKTTPGPRRARRTTEETP